MRKMSKENVIQTIIDYEVDYEHIVDSFYNEEDDFVVSVNLLKDNPKEVGDLIYKDLMDNKKLLKYLNTIDVIVKLIIASPYSYKTIHYEI